MLTYNLALQVIDDHLLDPLLALGRIGTARGRLTLFPKVHLGDVAASDASTALQEVTPAPGFRTPVPLFLELLSLHGGCVGLLHPELLIKSSQFLEHLELLPRSRGPAELITLCSLRPSRAPGGTHAVGGSHLVVDLLSHLVQVAVAGARLDELVGGEPAEFLVLLLFLQVLVHRLHQLPLLLGHERRLPHLEDPVELRALQGLQDTPVHLPEDKVSHILQLQSDQLQQGATRDLPQVGTVVGRVVL